MRTKLQRLIRSDWCFAALVAVLYIGVNAVLLYWHEPWRDEAQAWLISRDMSLPDMLRWASVDGHPVLWWLVLAPFSKLGMSYRLIGLISLFFMSAAVLLFARCAPLPRLLRAVLAFSPCCIYWYPVISRCYALIPLALICIAAAYPKRSERPVLYALALLFLSETHVVMEGLVGALMLLFCLEELALLKKRSVKPAPAFAGMALCVLAVAALYFQLVGSFSENIAYGNEAVRSVPMHLLGLCTNLLKIVRVSFGLTFLPQSAVIAVPLTLVFLAGVALWMRVSRKPALIFLLAVGFQVCVYEFVYSAVTEQRFLTVPLIFAFCVVLTVLERRKKTGDPGATLSVLDRTDLPWQRFSVAAASVLLLLLLLPLNSFWDDMLNARTELYSASGVTADYIKAELPGNALVIGDSEARASAVAAYFDRDTTFYNPRRHNGEMFSTWTPETSLPLDLDAVIAELSELPGAADRPWYLLVSPDYEYCSDHVLGGSSSYVEDGTLTLIASFYADSSRIADESYLLYRINH